MEQSFSNPAFRLMILNQVLNILIKNDGKQYARSAICFVIMDILSEDYCTGLYMEFRDSEELKLFPEVQKQKPPNVTDYWFPQNDWKSRIHIIKQAIAELESV